MAQTSEIETRVVFVVECSVLVADEFSCKLGILINRVVAKKI